MEQNTTLTLKHAAKRHHTTVRALYHAIEKGRLPAEKLGLDSFYIWLVKSADVKKWLLGRHQNPRVRNDLGQYTPVQLEAKYNISRTIIYNAINSGQLEYHMAKRRSCEKTIKYVFLEDFRTWVVMYASKKFKTAHPDILNESKEQQVWDNYQLTEVEDKDYIQQKNIKPFYAFRGRKKARE